MGLNPCLVSKGGTLAGQPNATCLLLGGHHVVLKDLHLRPRAHLIGTLHWCSKEHRTEQPNAAPHLHAVPAATRVPQLVLLGGALGLRAAGVRAGRARVGAAAHDLGSRPGGGSRVQGASLCARRLGKIVS